MRLNDQCCHLSCEQGDENEKQSLHQPSFNLTLSYVIGKINKTNHKRLLVSVHYHFLIIRSWLIQIIRRWCQFSRWKILYVIQLQKKIRASKEKVHLLEPPSASVKTLRKVFRMFPFPSTFSNDIKCSSNDCRGDTNLYGLQDFGRSLVQSFTFHLPSPPPPLPLGLIADARLPPTES